MKLIICPHKIAMRTCFKTDFAQVRYVPKSGVLVHGIRLYRPNNHLGKSATILGSNHGSGVCKEHYA